MNAISLDPVIDGTDGTTITCGADNVNGTSLNNFQEAKGDNVFDSPCIETNEATVWYSFTAGDDIYIENTTSADLSIALYTGVCGGLSLIQCDATGNLQLEDALTPGDTYFIQVAYPYGFDATFDFCVNSPLVPTPDDCATSEMLTLVDGVTTDAVQMDNFGATSTTESFTPSLIGPCTTGSFSTIYYQFTIGGVGNTHVNINYDETGASPIMNSQITVLLDCTAATAFNGYEWTGSTDENICLMAGTYYIQIASCDADEGDYTLALTPNTPPSNDECAAADLFNDPITMAPVAIVPPICEVYNVVGTTVNACPEATALGSTCEFDTESTVWYTFTTNATATQEAEITLNPSGATPIVNGTFALLEGPCDGTLVGTCQTDFTEANIVLNPNTQYYIVVSQQSTGTTGTFDLDLEITSTPTNDECDLVNNPVIMDGTSGTTICADGEVNYCGMPTTDDHQVFYQYTNTTGGNVDLTVTFNPDVTNGMAATDISMIVLEDNCTTFTFFDGTTGADYCNILSTPQNIDCIEDGETIIIVVGSPDDGSQGEFTVSLTENTTQPTDDNDECADALNIFDPALDNTCEWITINGTTVEACPEDFPVVGCDYELDPVVWYSFIAPTSANPLTVELQNLVGTGVLYATIFEMTADCDIQTILAGANCDSGTGPFGPYDIVSGTTYLIGVGDDMEGPHSFDIKVNELPANDDCIDAEVLVANTATPGTTICATQEAFSYNSAVCMDTDETNTVWYEVTVGPGEKGFNLTVSGGGLIPITMGMINAVVFETTAAGCVADASTFEDEDCLTLATLSEQFECIGEGTYIIRISTSDANAGDFEILFEPLLLEQPNDFCDAPDVITFAPQLECEWMTVDASTVGACPESFDFANNCGFDDFPVVWYEATAPANAEFLDLQINNGGVNPFIAVFESSIDCDNLTSVAGSDCYSGTFDDLNAIGQLQIDITPGSTYLIGIGTDNTNGNIIDFGIKWITPPDNDECVNAEIFMPVNPGTDPGTFTQTFTMETTQCATEMFVLSGTACDDNNTNTVWYTYTVEMDVKEITIDVTNYIPTNGGVADFSIYVSDACPDGSGNINLLNQADGTSATYCGGEGTELITLSCIDEGTTITFSITSSTDNEGTFDVTLNTAMPNCTYTNDECADASPLTGNPDPLITDDPTDCVLVAGCNDLACAEMPFDMPCGITALNTVFYTFMTDAIVDPVEGAFVNIEILNGEAGELDSPGAVLFDGDCTAAIIGACAGTGGLGTFNSGPLGGPGVIQPNSTYTIMIYNADPDQNGGTFDLCVTVTSGCVNDEACDAFTLDPGITVTNPASSVNCTPDVSISGCSPEFDEATLWYQVEVPEGFSFFEITLVNGGVPNGVGDGLGEVSITVGPLDDCNNIVAGDVIYSNCTGFATNTGVHSIPCAIEYGTYYVQIGSEDELDAGDFEITFTPLDDADPINDLCSQATELVVDVYCEFIQFNGTLKGACPEINDVNACQFSENSAVWYKITIPTGTPVVSDMDVLIQGLNNPIIGIYEFDCSQVSEPSMGIVSTPNLGNGTPAGCVENTFAGGAVITPGNEYYILVSSSTNEQTTFTISIKLNAPPINDDPCDMSINPPFDLTGGGSHNGTTCCARGPKDENPDGSLADFENVDCSSATDDAAVWYTLVPDENVDGYDVILDNIDIGGNVTVEVYWGAPDAGCGAGFTETVASSCADQNTVLAIPNCPMPGEILYVKVTTDDADNACGDFVLSITPASCPNAAADDCEDAEILMTITPPDCQSGEMLLSIDGCLDYACAETAFAECAVQDGPTVWYQIDIDSEDATKLITQVEADGFVPIWNIYQGTSCTDMVPILEPQPAPEPSFPCSSSDGIIGNVHQTPITDDPVSGEIFSYWIAITATGDIEDGSFTLNYGSSLGCIACSGEDAFDCENGDFIALIDDVEVDYDPFDPNSLNPFCPGTEVTVCLEFNYNTTGTGNDWLHGIIPSFGSGWDIENIDFTSLDLGSGNWEWADADGACAPYLNGYNLPNVCTYMEDGILKLCNTACDPNCPCEGPLLDNSPLPSGWFWNSPGGGPTCANECTPSDDWGVPGGVNVDVDICIDLVIKSYDPNTSPLTYDEWCEENGDLQINIQTTSDAISGCWIDTSPCIIDPSFTGPEWEINCDTPPLVNGDPQELCDNGTTDIQVTTDDGSSTTIIVNPIPNPNVTGATMYTFDDGNGTIMDNLDNTTDQIQIQIYEAFAFDPTKPCPGVITLIEVTIYPELMVEFDDFDVCEGDCITISPMVFGGIGNPYTYIWETGETTPSITVCPIVATTYAVTVSDDLGCMGSADTEVIVNPPVILSFEEDPIEACQDGNFDPFQPEYIATLVFESGTAPYTINWLPEPGLIGEVTSVNSFNDSWLINEELSFSALSPLELCAEVIDAAGCISQACMTVNITGLISLTPNIMGLECGVDNAIINIVGFDSDGNNITDFNLFGGCPEQDLLETGFSSNGSVNFNINETYLLNYDQFTIQGITASGCVASICVDLVVPQGTPIEISGTENICEGEEATISITNAVDAGYVDFVWTPDIGNSASVSFNPTSTMTYFVEVMDDVGCVSDTSFAVVVNPDPTIGLSGTTSFCSGGTASISATGGDIYNWIGTIGTANGNTYTANSEGTVSLEVIDVNGCSSDTTVTFTQEDIITVNIGGNNLCDEVSDTLFVTGSFTSYEWIFNATVVGNDSILIISEAGVYDINVVDITGCSGVGTIDIENFASPQIEVTDSITVCNEDSGIGPVMVNFNDQVVGDAGDWSQLDNVAGFDPNDVSAVDFTGIAPGCYAFVYETSGATAPCMNTTDTMYVCVEACPCPRPDTSPIPNLCNDDTYDLTDSEVTTDAGTWNTILGPSGQDLTGLITDAVFDANDILPGLYTVEFSLTSPGNVPPCTISSTQEFEVFENEEITVMDGIMCNIDGQPFPTTLDLYSLISLDASDGGVWVQIGEPMVNITGGSIINSSDLVVFPVDLVFSYTSVPPAGSPCDPQVVNVTVEIRDCNCKFVNVLSDTLCNNGGLISLLDLLENPDDLSGTWSVTPDALVGTDMFDSNVSSGLYEIRYTLTESAGPGCDTEYFNNILVRRQPAIDIVEGPQPCSEDTGNGPTTVDLYDWLASTTSSGSWTQTGGTTVSFVDDGNSAIIDFMIFEPLDEFEFTFTTNSADDPCTDIMSSITIIVNDCECPIINPFVLDDACNDDDIIDLNPLSAGSDPGTFTFFNSGGSDLSSSIDMNNMLNVTGLPDGTYTVVYTLNTIPTGNCIGSESASIEIQDYNTIDGEMTADVCSDPNGNDPTVLNFLQLVVGSSFEGWEDVDNTMVDLSDNLALQAVDFSGVAEGDYEFTFTIDNIEPCEDYVHTLIVSVTENCDCPSINPLTPMDVCNTDGPVDLTQYDDPMQSGTWSSTELTINDGNSLEISGVSAGVYTLTYNITNPLPNCPETADVMILIGEPANPGIPAEPYRLCEGVNEVISLTDLLDGEDIGGIWTETSSTSSNGFDEIEATLTTDSEVAGTYTFEYTISNNDPCPSVSETVTVVIEANPIADAGLEKFIDCINTTVTLGGPNTTEGSDIEYTWVNTTIGEDVVGTTATIEITDEGVYELTVLNTTTGCSARNMVEVIKSDDLPTMIVTPQDISCSGFDDGGVVLTAQSGGDGNYTYSLNGATATTNPNEFTTLPAGSYTIEIIDGVGCSQSYTFMINEPEPLIIEAGPAIIVGDLGESFELSIEPFDTSTITSLVWSISETTEIICSGLNCTTITVTPTELTNYYVEVMNSNGCPAFDEVQIQLQQIVDVVFPNIITPNGDNINDDFYIKSDDVETVISMKIFDRWGEKLFDLGNFPPRDPQYGWDGKFNGKAVVPGVYVFTVELLFVNGENRTISGDVTVTDSE